MQMANSNFTTEELNNEIWLPVTVNPNYAVSNLGRVKRTKQSSGAVAGRIMRQYPSNHSSLRVMLHYGERNRTINHLTHRLVALAFIGEPPEGKNNVNHIDCNPQNNRVENLEWVSHKENSRHMVNLGNSRRGEKSHHTTLKDADIPVIWEAIQSGFTLKDIGQRFGVSANVIGDIKRGNTWRHIKIVGRNIPDKCPTCGHVLG